MKKAPQCAELFKVNLFYGYCRRLNQYKEENKKVEGILDSII